MTYHEKVAKITQILAMHYGVNTDINVRLTPFGEMSGMSYEYWPPRDGTSCGSVSMILPPDWLERVYNRGLAFIKYGSGILVMQAAAVEPPAGADGAWVVNCVRMGEQHKGRQFGMVGNVVSYGGRTWYHGDSLDKAMEVAANSTMIGLGIDTVAKAR